MTHRQPGQHDPRRQPPAVPPQFGTQPPHERDYRQGQYGHDSQYGQQPQFQPGWQPYQPYQPPRQYPRPRKKHTGLKIALGAGGGILALVVIAAAASSGSPRAAAGAPPAHAAAAKPVTVATFTGSGAQKTAPFTVPASWRLDYSFDCSGFGYKGNFVVLTDSGSDYNGATVNDLAMSKAAVTYAYGDAGTHYLDVNSECSWKIKVTGLG